MPQIMNILENQTVFAQAEKPVLLGIWDFDELFALEPAGTTTSLSQLKADCLQLSAYDFSILGSGIGLNKKTGGQEDI